MLVFDWSKFTEEQYHHMMALLCDEDDQERTYIGCAHVGDAALDILVNSENDPRCVDIDCYVYGIDSGYGYADDGTPYDYLSEHSTDFTLYEFKDYESFKHLLESEYENEIERAGEPFRSKLACKTHMW